MQQCLYRQDLIDAFLSVEAGLSALLCSMLLLGLMGGVFFGWFTFNSLKKRIEKFKSDHS